MVTTLEEHSSARTLRLAFLRLLAKNPEGVLMGIREPISEYLFARKDHKNKKWKLDFAWPHAKIAVDIESGPNLWNKQKKKDSIEKRKVAAAMGWKVIRCFESDLLPFSERSNELLVRLVSTFRSAARTIAAPNPVVLPVPPSDPVCNPDEPRQVYVEGKRVSVMQENLLREIAKSECGLSRSEMLKLNAKTRTVRALLSKGLIECVKTEFGLRWKTLPAITIVRK